MNWDFHYKRKGTTYLGEWALRMIMSEEKSKKKKRKKEQTEQTEQKSKRAKEHKSKRAKERKTDFKM